MTKPTSEEQWRQWMLESQQGNQQSYRKLLSELLPAFKGFARTKITRSADVDDIVQLAVIAIHKSLNTYQKDRSFTSWAFAILRYKIIDYYRASAKMITVELDEAQHISNPDDETDTDTGSSNILEILESIPQKYRQPIQLTKVEGFSIKETAEKLGLSESAIKTRCSRGYKMIKTKMVQNVYE